MESDLARSVERAKFVWRQRRMRAWTQEQLADVASLSTRTIQRLEKDGSAAPETLMAVAQAFKLNVRQLTQQDGSMDTVSSQRYVLLLPRLAVGSDLTGIVANTERFQIEHDDDDDQRSVLAMQDVVKELKCDIVRLYDAPQNDRIRIEEELSRELKGLESLGYYLFGTKRVIPRIDDGHGKFVSMATIYISHCRSPVIVRDNNRMVIPALLTEVANDDNAPR
jgi:transcriptional regulator with XRE-family HTH domain